MVVYFHNDVVVGSNCISRSKWGPLESLAKGLFTITLNCDSSWF